MSAYYVFDLDKQRGPFERQQIATMWKHGRLTANAQYYDYEKEEWRRAAELASPLTTAFKDAVVKAKQALRRAAKFASRVATDCKQEVVEARRGLPRAADLASPIAAAFKQAMAGATQGGRRAANCASRVATACKQEVAEARQGCRRDAELASPIAAAFTRPVAEAKRPKLAEGVAEQKRLPRKVVFWVYSVSGVSLVSLLAAVLTSDPSSDADYQAPPISHLAAEGRQTTAEFEEPNRNHAFTTGEDIKRRRADLRAQSRSMRASRRTR